MTRSRSKYREFMDNRQWFYELSRRFDGRWALSAPPSEAASRYDDPEKLGHRTGLELHHPAQDAAHHRCAGNEVFQTLQLPKRPWGTEADEAFHSLASTAGPDGKVPDWDNEKLATDASWPIMRRLDAADVTDEVLLRYARHPDQGVRQIAANAIGRKSGDAMILQLLRDKRSARAQRGMHGHRHPDRSQGQGRTAAGRAPNR